MKLILRNLSLFIIVSGFLFSLSSKAIAQPAIRAKERVEQLKKIKMLDFLELDERKADKLLIAYNKADKRIDGVHEKLEEANKKLVEMTESGAADDELRKENEKVLGLMDDLHSAHKAKMMDIKSILSEQEFSKFLIFEANFNKELRKILFKKHKRMRKGRD